MKIHHNFSVKKFASGRLFVKHEAFEICFAFVSKKVFLNKKSSPAWLMTTWTKHAFYGKLFTCPNKFVQQERKIVDNLPRDLICFPFSSCLILAAGFNENIPENHVEIAYYFAILLNLLSFVQSLFFATVLLYSTLSWAFWNQFTI